jgi:hypothetical protein
MGRNRPCCRRKPMLLSHECNLSCSAIGSVQILAADGVGSLCSESEQTRIATNLSNLKALAPVGGLLAKWCGLIPTRRIESRGGCRFRPSAEIMASPPCTYGKYAQTGKGVTSFSNWARGAEVSRYLIDRTRPRLDPRSQARASSSSRTERTGDSGSASAKSRPVKRSHFRIRLCAPE